MPVEPYYLDQAVSRYEKGVGTAAFRQSQGASGLPLLAQARGVPPPGRASLKKFSLKHVNKRFESCREAAEALAATKPGETKPGFEGRAVGTTVVEEPDGTFVAKAGTKWSLDPSATTITVPRWTWPKMTSAESAAVRRFEADLIVHEQGHVTIAEEVIKTFSPRVSGRGTSRKEAIENAKRKMDELEPDLRAKIEKRFTEYDQVTSDGRTQSQGPAQGFPGGNDVRLDCPRKQ